MRDNNAAGRNFAAPRVVTVRLSRSLMLFCPDPLDKGTGRSRRRAPLAITPMNRPSEAARTAGCAVAKRKPQTGGIFFFHEDTNKRAFLLAYRVTSRARMRHRRGRKGVAKGGGLGIEVQSNGSSKIREIRSEIAEARAATAARETRRIAGNNFKLYNLREQFCAVVCSKIVASRIRQCANNDPYTRYLR